MKTYLVTGGAGFIGANYIKFLLHEKYKDEAIKVVVLDALTYAGNLGTIKDDIDDERCLEHRRWVEEVTSGDYQKYYEQMYGGRESHATNEQAAC